MPPRVATVLFFVGIFFLFALNRKRDAHYSKALWIPVIWLLIAGSRNVGQWLDMSSPMDQDRYLEGNPIDRVVLGSLMAIGLVIIFQRLKKAQAILTANFAVLLYFFYCGFSSLWSDYPDVSFKRWFRGAGDLIMVLVILTDDHWLESIKRIVSRVVLFLFPLSVLLIRYYPNLGRGYNIAGSAMFWTGVTTDKNGLGVLCLIFGLATVWNFLELYKEQKQNGGKWTKPFYVQGFLVLIMIWLLWESNSMTSISCFVLSLSLLLSVGRWQFARKPLATTFLTLSAVGLSAMVLFGGFGAVLEALGRNPTLTGRTEVWHILLPFAQNPWVGSGYESFWLGDRLKKIGNLTSNGINEAHNGYLEIYLNLGWIGLILLGIVILSGYRRVIAAIRLNPEEGKVRLAYFLIPLIYNFTEAAYKMMSPVWIFFLIAIMAPLPAPTSESPAKIESETSQSLPVSKRRMRYALGNRL
jgi:O-antigen ligase